MGFLFLYHNWLHLSVHLNRLLDELGLFTFCHRLTKGLGSENAGHLTRLIFIEGWVRPPIKCAFSRFCFHPYHKNGRKFISALNVAQWSFNFRLLCKRHKSVAVYQGGPCRLSLQILIWQLVSRCHVMRGGASTHLIDRVFVGKQTWNHFVYFSTGWQKVPIWLAKSLISG